jgi:hypothetical protein
MATLVITFVSGKVTRVSFPSKRSAERAGAKLKRDGVTAETATWRVES